MENSGGRGGCGRIGCIALIVLLVIFGILFKDLILLFVRYPGAFFLLVFIAGGFLLGFPYSAIGLFRSWRR